MRLFTLLTSWRCTTETVVSTAVQVARARRGTQFDPKFVDGFCAIAPAALSGAADSHDAHDLISGEPGLLGRLSDMEFDAALEGLADFTDLRCASRAGHSRGVADLAGAAARTLRLPAVEVVATRRAGLVHDIGLHGAPVTILDKPGPLSATQWERVRVSSYYTERVLARPAALARIGAIAAFAQRTAAATTGASAVRPYRCRPHPAAACAFRAMTEPRAHRGPLTASQARRRCSARHGR